MPGVSGRFNTMVKAKVSRLLDRAEDPAESLDYGYQKQIELLQNVKSLWPDLQLFLCLGTRPSQKGALAGGSRATQMSGAAERRFA